jgi:hypothetical protein
MRSKSCIDVVFHGLSARVFRQGLEGRFVVMTLAMSEAACFQYS